MQNRLDFTELKVERRGSQMLFGYLLFTILMFWSTLSYSCSTPSGYIQVGSGASPAVDALSDLYSSGAFISGTNFHVIDEFVIDIPDTFYNCEFIVDGDGGIAI